MRFRMHIAWLLLLMISCSLAAQEWSPYVPGQVSYYTGYDKFNNEEILLKKYIDTSYKRNKYTAHYFHQGFSDSCHAYEVSFDYYSLDSLIERKDYFTYYSNQDSQLFYTESIPGFSWKIPVLSDRTYQYDSIKITFDSLGIYQFFGQKDSVKYFSLQPLKNGNPLSNELDSFQLILSKHYGFLQSINLMPIAGHSGGGLNYEFGYLPLSLVGIATQQDTMGEVVSSIKNILDYNVGTVLKWKDDFDGNPPYGDETKYYRDSITDVEEVPDGIKIWFDRQKLQNGTISFSKGNRTFYYEQFKPVANANSNYLHRYFSMEALDEITFISHFKKEQNDWCATMYLDGLLLYDPCYIAQAPDNTTSYTLCQKQGLKQYYVYGYGGSHALSLIGYRSPSDTFGNVSRLTVGGIESGLSEKLSVNPSLANYNLRIFVEGIKQELQYKILSLDGSLLKSGTFTQQTTIQVSQLPKGIYLIRLRTDEGQVVKKFVKQ